MSHTLGPIGQNNRQSNVNLSGIPDDSPSKELAFSIMPTLSDSDYEFLFNQLLEGIAHGWHERRIVKFFARVEDRANQEYWIAWLERLRAKASALPSQSKQQLGTMMIRLGELTRSTAEVSQIGAVSHRIGKELLFGNIDVWEYVGPDLPSKRDRIEPELSDRLPDNLTVDTHPIGKKIAEESLKSPQNRPKTELRSKPLEPVVSSTAEPNTPEQNDSEESLEIESYWEEDVTEETVAPSSADSELNHLKELKPSQEPKPDRELDLLEELTAYLQDFPQGAYDTEPTASLPEKSTDEDEAVEFNNSTPNARSQWDSDRFQNNPPLHIEKEIEAIDIQRLIDLIQEDEELAQQISQKLNLALARPQNTASQLDRSSIELIESWFTLGLKQVSAGELTKAIASWEKALSIDPNLSEAWHNRGSALGRLGNYPAAIESFQNALAIDPNNYQAWNDRAHALYQLQDWVEAVDSWNNAIKIMPGNHLFWYNRGCALERLGIWDEAIASHEKALEIVPDFQPARSRYINLVADNSRSN